MTLIDALVVSLNLDASKFKAGQTEANAGLKAIGEGASKTGQDVAKVAQGMAQGFAKVRTELLGLLGLFLAGRSVGGLTREITNQDAALGRLSNRLGVSTEDLAGWDRAAQSAGAQAGEAVGSVAGLSAAFEKFKLTGQGGDTFIPYLSRLGVHLRNANGEMKNATEQQLELARAFQAQDRTDPKATDFLGGQLPGMTQGMIDVLRRGAEFVQGRLDKQRALGLPTRQDTENAQNILEQLGYVDQRAQTFGRHLLNDVSPGITRVLTRLGDWLDRHLPGWYAKIDPIIQKFMGALDKLNFDHVVSEVETFGKRVWTAFDALANWQPPAWIAHLLGLDSAGAEAAQPATDSGSTSLGDRIRQTLGLGQTNYNPTGTKADDAEMAAADRNGVPRDFARKIFAIEHGLDENGNPLTSKAGAIGAGQLMPDTARDLKVDPYNLEQNVDGSTRHMKMLLDLFHGNQAAAAAAYNAGQNSESVKSFAASGDMSSLPDETKKYVRKFNAHWFESDRSGKTADLHQTNREQSWFTQAKPEINRYGGLWDRAYPQAPHLTPGNASITVPPLPNEHWENKPPVAPGSFEAMMAGLREQGLAASLMTPTAAQRWGGSVTNNTAHHDNSSETHIGTVNVHTQAKDAHGIARDIGGALKARMMAAQANRGLR
ncbi:MAG: transglycosylase SLT domain-containing protein [Janthinobacterium lividum]